MRPTAGAGGRLAAFYRVAAAAGRDQVVADGAWRRQDDFAGADARATCREPPARLDGPSGAGAGVSVASSAAGSTNAEEPIISACGTGHACQVTYSTLATSTPVSSRASRITASSGVSPGSTNPASADTGSRARRATAQQAAIAGLHEHRDRRVGTRKLNQPADGAAATVAGCLDHGDVTGAPAIALDAVPADERDRVGRERRFRRFEPGGEPPQRRELKVRMTATATATATAATAATATAATATAATATATPPPASYANTPPPPGRARGT